MPSYVTTPFPMKKPVVLYPSIGLLLIIGVSIILTGFISEAWAQKTVPAGKLVTATVSRAATNSSSRFLKAATENTRLRGTLTWDFSGKRQTGWDLYVPLISHTIESESGPDTAD